MEKIKLDIQGSGTCTDWKSGFDIVKTFNSAIQNGILTDDSNISGTLNVKVAIPKHIETVQGKFSDFFIHTDDSYIQYEDEVAMEVLKTKLNHPEAFTKEDAAKVSASQIDFVNNKNIVNCDFLEYFGYNNVSWWANQQKFFGCSNLKSVRLPKGLYQMGGTYGRVFGNCPSLESIYLNEITSLGSHTFEGTTNIKKVIVKSIEAFLSIAGTTYVHHQSFPWHGGNASIYLVGQEDTPITELTIPLTIKQIWGWALYNIKTITKLSYEGTVEQWKALPKNVATGMLSGQTPNWHYNVPVDVIHCVDGDCGLDETNE